MFGLHRSLSLVRFGSRPLRIRYYPVTKSYSNSDVILITKEDAEGGGPPNTDQLKIVGGCFVYFQGKYESRSNRFRIPRNDGCVIFYPSHTHRSDSKLVPWVHWGCGRWGGNLRGPGARGCGAPVRGSRL